MSNKTTQEILKQEKWTPPAGNFGLYSDGILDKAPSEKGFQMFGTEFKTESDGIRAQRDFKFYHWMWHLANELNEGKDYEANALLEMASGLFNDADSYDKAIEIIKQWDWYWSEK